MGIQNRFTEAYGLTHPFACAGLAFAGTTPPLAIAVSNAGAIGAIGAGKLPPPALAEIFKATRAAANGPLNINFITIFTDDAHIETCCALKPEVVSFHWGHPPRAWIEQLHGAGIKVWEQVGSVEAARTAVEDGIDLIIAQGSEAGGHNYGSLPLFALLPLIIDEVSPTPVLAAGGIADGRGVAAALALGADGVWVGTRMAATAEADIAGGYKDRLVAAEGTDTAKTSLFGRDIADFNPMRVLTNKIVREWAEKEDEAPDVPEDQPVVGRMELAGMEMPLHRFSNVVPMSTATGDFEEMPLLSGQGVGLIDDIRPAGEIIEEMMIEARQILTKLGKAAL